MAQKPTENTFLNNMIKYDIGLINTNVRVGDDMFPSNVLSVDNINEAVDKVFMVKKPNREEKGEFNNHMTVKPLELCEHILRLAAFSKNAIVLDPFIGSGTTALAAKKLGLNYIGIDINPEYVEIAKKRLDTTKKEKPLTFSAQKNILDSLCSQN